jgi:predicted kinase
VEIDVKIIYDFDGTLCDITHRVHHVRGEHKNYDAFFRECVKDAPQHDVIESLRSHVRAGDNVEIWSGRSDAVREESEQWLNDHIGPCWYDDDNFIWAGQLLRRMRPARDFQPDDQLKLKWLQDEIARTGRKPDMVYDDRQRIVDMWRANGVTCAQVAPGDFDDRHKFKQPRRPTLTVMIGASGAGKSTWIEQNGLAYHVVSSDVIRENQFPGKNGIDPAAYTPAGFAATFGTAHAMVKVLIDGGVNVVYDATNIRRKDRVDFLKNVGIIDADLNRARDDVNVIYQVVERSLEDKLASFDSAPRYQTNRDVIVKHDNTYKSNRKDIMRGDGIEGVTVEVGE